MLVAERIKGSVRAHIDSVTNGEDNTVAVRGWLVGARRGALSICSRADRATVTLEERPDACYELKSDPVYTWGFVCRLDGYPRDALLELELWVDRMPTLRLLDPKARSVPSLTPPQDLIDAIGSGDFHSVGREFFDYFRLLADLRPFHRVLDIGCGTGRMALQLTRYLHSPGSYQGFDVNPRVIEWCQQNITPQWPNFSFSYTPFFNSLYNHDACEQAAGKPFPYPDASFDFVFATSVFTHLLPEDAAHYISEMSRVLKPGGHSLVTFFLLNDSARDFIAAGKSNITFPFEVSDVARIHDEKVPEYAVSYDEAHVQKLYLASGLKILAPIFYGGWVRRPDHLTFQDVVIARRTP